jgi:hypothetical protein
MKFFILGDSWGVGEWTKKSGLFEPIPDTGVDYYLTQLGHTVTNISAGSAGNFGQLRHAYWTLKEKSDYDYIIWFHTESMRDIEEIVINDPSEGARYFPNFDISDWNSCLNYLDLENYNCAQTIWNEFHIPFIVIGGQSPINPVICQFTFARYTITSWLAELLNLDFIPPKNTFFSWIKIKRILDHYKINERQFIKDNINSLDQADIVEKIANDSELFPDNSHPSSACFEQLAQRILTMVLKNDQQ